MGRTRIKLLKNPQTPVAALESWTAELLIFILLSYEDFNPRDILTLLNKIWDFLNYFGTFSESVSGLSPPVKPRLLLLRALLVPQRSVNWTCMSCSGWKEPESGNRWSSRSGPITASTTERFPYCLARATREFILLAHPPAARPS